MNSSKLAQFKKANSNELEIYQALSPQIFRKECVQKVIEIAESDNMLMEFEKNPLSENKYQHTWRYAYAKLKNETGICVYEILGIDRDAKVKIELLQNLQIDSYLFAVLRSMEHESK
jgi:hypothetical protein